MRFILNVVHISSNFSIHKLQWSLIFCLTYCPTDTTQWTKIFKVHTSAKTKGASNWKQTWPCLMAWTEAGPHLYIPGGGAQVGKKDKVILIIKKKKSKNIILSQRKRILGFWWTLSIVYWDSWPRSEKLNFCCQPYKQHRLKSETI